jgi:ribose transport system substrate-binding protein
MLVIVLALALCLGVAGCTKVSDTEASKPGAPAAAKPRIALIMKSLANEFFKTMEKGAREHQAAHSSEYDLLANGIKDELDVARQVQLVEQMIAEKVTAIVIAPADSKALVAVCKRAMNAGIVVINIDNKFDTEVMTAENVKIPFVGPDNRKGARIVAEHLAKNLPQGAPVAIIEGIPSAFNGQQRKLGFDDAVKAAGLNTVTSQSADWEMARANQVVSAVISEHPEIQGVLCANDSMALGAVAALKTAGKIDTVKVIGYDGISAVAELIKEGKILATIDQHADQLAAFGIDYALEVIKTKAVPADKETPVDLVVK